MKRLIHSIALAAVCLALMTQNVQATELLIPGGQAIGLELCDDTVTVAAFDDACGARAKAAGLCIGDEIVSIDGITIDSVQDVRTALRQCDKDAAVTVRRSGKTRTLRICPEMTVAGPRLGIFLRQGIAGIGTVTYYDPETGDFGTLGHGVSNNGGNLLEMTKGSAYFARILSVKKGQCGQPGLLRGNAESLQAIGELRKNTAQGVFGTMYHKHLGQPLPTADYEDVHLGKAWIRSTVEGDTVREYSVEILKIYPEERSDHRNFLLKVTDPDLLDVTGGIVQGMSGSPLIQDGKIIGAVTHVLVNDPTMGYGIFIENMLDAAG